MTVRVWGVWALGLTLLAGCAAVAARDEDKASIAGNWKGRYKESNGGEAAFPLELAEDKDGKLTGLWNVTRTVVQNGTRVGDRVAWTMTYGPRTYEVKGKVLDGGKKLSLEYVYTWKEKGQLKKVTGAATLIKE
jgi:hypothetical protein